MNRVLQLFRPQVTSARLCSGITKRPSPNEVTKANAEFDQVTHTGQAWDKADYRLQRFDTSKKQINPNIAMNLIAERPAQDCGNERVVCCDGGHPALGHPRVFINLCGVVLLPKELVVVQTCKLNGTFPDELKQIGPLREWADRKFTKEELVEDKPGVHACGYCGNRFYNSHITKGDDLKIEHLNC